jgi:hypothetical protein
LEPLAATGSALAGGSKISQTPEIAKLPMRYIFHTYLRASSGGAGELKLTLTRKITVYHLT